MARVNIEMTVKVGENDYEVLHKEYVIPDRIAHNGAILIYDTYRGCYVSQTDATIISAKDYIKMKLNEKKEHLQETVSSLD